LGFERIDCGDAVKARFVQAVSNNGTDKLLIIHNQNICLLIAH